MGLRYQFANRPKAVNADDIAKLWVKLTNAFGHKFISNFGVRDNGVWLEALKEFDWSDVEYGFNKMLATVSDDERKKNEAWPPNAKEFRMLCERRLADYELPSAGKAFNEVQTKLTCGLSNFSHPLLGYVLVCLELPANRNLEAEDYPQFKKIYDDLCWRYMRVQVFCSAKGINQDLKKIKAVA